MKTVVILLGVFVAFVAADAECPLMDAIENNFDKCANLMNADDIMMKNVMHGYGIYDDDSNCFRACIMQQAGLMVKGKVDIPRMEDMMNSCQHPKVRIFVAVTKFCKPRVEWSDDGCKVAQNYMRCYKAVENHIKYSQAKEEEAKKAEEQKAHEKQHKEDK